MYKLHVIKPDNTVVSFDYKQKPTFQDMYSHISCEMIEMSKAYYPHYSNRKDGYVDIYFDEEFEGSEKAIILLNPPKFENNSESEINFKLLHEIGHFLGLKHPFDCDGVCSDDLTTADTVMEYKGSNIYPSFFTELDILAINKLWD